MLDPLLPLLVRALRSRHAPSVTTALNALTLLMQSQLPGLAKTAAGEPSLLADCLLTLLSLLVCVDYSPSAFLRWMPRPVLALSLVACCVQPHPPLHPCCTSCWFRLDSSATPALLQMLARR